MAEVGRIGLADDNAAGGLDTAGYGAVEFGDLVLLEDGAAGVAQALAGFEILDGDGQAVQEAEFVAAHDGGFGGAGGVKGAVAVYVEVSVDGWVDAFDAGEDGLDDFDWGELLGADGR